MEKKNIEAFIKKYHLGGQIESVMWENINDDLSVTAITSDRKLIEYVQLKDGAKNFINGVKVGVNDTSKLKKQIAFLSDNISLTLDVDKNDPTRVIQILGDDGNNSSEYPTADLSVIDPVPTMKNIPLFDVEIKLSPEWIDTFNKGFATISDDNTLFTLIMSKKKNKMEMVLGYKKNLSARVALGVDAVVGKDVVKNPINFSAKKLKEILAANSDVQNPSLLVSQAGLANISFESDNIKSKYYLIQVEVDDD